MSQVKNPVIKPKRVIILRGVPGSGKSSLARFAYKPQGAKIISSDDPFFSMRTSGWIYHPSKEYQSHRYVQTSFIVACQAGERTIVVDDFNAAKEDLLFYDKIAEFFGYAVEKIRLPFHDPPTNWRRLSRDFCEKMQADLDAQPLEENERALLQNFYHPL
jgi:hypothetical protein